MGRRPTRSGAVPHLRLRKRGQVTYYYYDKGGKPRVEIPLGTSYPDAIRRWSELESAGTPGAIIYFKDAAEKYRREVIPTKAIGTQKVNMRELSKLGEWFNDPPARLSDIKPLQVQQYMRWRKDAPHSATREKALLSHLWNECRAWGFTNEPNPCRGIRGAGKSQRKVYVEDALLKKLKKHADQPLLDALDLAYLCGQRPQDTLGLEKPRDGFLHLTQRKTDHRQRIQVVGELKEVLARIARRKSRLGVQTVRLVVDEAGGALTKDQLRYRFDKARELAGIPKDEFQFRDLRAKAATDKAESAGSTRAAQRQLGHKSEATTEGYIRNRRGEKVTPTR